MIKATHHFDITENLFVDSLKRSEETTKHLENIVNQFEETIKQKPLPFSNLKVFPIHLTPNFSTLSTLKQLTIYFGAAIPPSVPKPNGVIRRSQSFLPSFFQQQKKDFHSGWAAIILRFKMNDLIIISN